MYTISSAIKAELARRDKRQHHLAEVLGMSTPAANRRLTGEIEWRLSELQAIAAWLDIPLSALVPSLTERDAG